MLNSELNALFADKISDSYLLPKRNGGLRNLAHFYWATRYVCMFFKDLRLKALTGPKVVPNGRVADDTMLWHVFRAVMFPGRAWHVIVVPIGLTLWSGQLSAQLHVISAQILR